MERAVALAAGNTIEVDDLQLNADPLLAKAEPAISNGHGDEHAASEHQIIDSLPGFRLDSTQIQDYLDSIEQQILEYALKISQNLEITVPVPTTDAQREAYAALARAFGNPTNREDSAA